MSIAENLKHHRMAKNWSQQELAEISGVSQAQISYIENGKKKNPGVITLKKLADALGVSVEELIESRGDDDV
ncbi:XRE family transcriptional regulator [Geobacillus phage vB_GthS_PK2.1]|nr:XRE family transcriptional regulator [Geobacillus phage vB_GthS_PK2.1]